ncbi:MAG: hypothetical protein K2K15_03645 [Anaeroplasmataceae bacterium]|nr:hypothetical protein [Anaeroplasmataceae bacterium]
MEEKNVELENVSSKVEETSVKTESPASSNEEKENGFVKALKMFGKYLKNTFLNFLESFKYNNMKLAAILVAIPGLLLGFFLSYHYKVVIKLSYEVAIPDFDTMQILRYQAPGMPFDYSGIVLFVLMLFGILNIFSAVSMSGKKNKKSVILATVLTGVILVAGVMYLYSLFYCLYLVKSPADYTYHVNIDGFGVNTDFVMSCISVIGSMVSSVAGCILGFIRYDRNYKEVKR